MYTQYHSCKSSTVQQGGFTCPFDMDGGDISRLEEVVKNNIPVVINNHFYQQPTEKLPDSKYDFYKINPIGPICNPTDETTKPDVLGFPIDNFQNIADALVYISEKIGIYNSDKIKPFFDKVKDNPALTESDVKKLAMRMMLVTSPNKVPNKAISQHYEAIFNLKQSL